MRFLLTLCLCTLAGILRADSTYFSGRWTASQRGVKIEYVFSKDSIVQIIQGTDTMKAVFHIDTTTKPGHMDLRVIDKYSGETLYLLPGIYEIGSPDRFRLRLSNNMKDRPSGFMPRGNPEVLTLNRRK